jgi:predicted transcriptional regulator
MPVNSNPRLLFEFLFFSLQQFTFFGYGNLLPSSVLAKILSMLELTISFLTVLFILSDFNSLKESLLTRVDTRKDEDE